MYKSSFIVLEMNHLIAHRVLARIKALIVVGARQFSVVVVGVVRGRYPEDDQRYMSDMATVTPEHDMCLPCLGLYLGNHSK